ncbi:STAS domain-containing protein [Nonomuraea sp. NPDC049714]|uniref:STAS domain-containing protein n=1 Tax=Nonomuraea sp. NPDC049714 TaxID=3364357 RepID=UPI0037BD3F28
MADTAAATAVGTVTVSVAGELDIATVDVLRTHLLQVLERAGGEVVLELSGLSFIDAAGLGALVALRGQARLHRTELLLAGVPAPMARLLRITGLDGHFLTLRRQSPGSPEGRP